MITVNILKFELDCVFKSIAIFQFICLKHLKITEWNFGKDTQKVNLNDPMPFGHKNVENITSLIKTPKKIIHIFEDCR